jgi:hypothetical protein
MAREALDQIWENAVIIPALKDVVCFRPGGNGETPSRPEAIRTTPGFAQRVALAQQNVTLPNGSGEGPRGHRKGEGNEVMR